MQTKFLVLLFSLSVFVLTAIGLGCFYYGLLVLPFISMFVYIVAWAAVLALAFNSFISRGKLQGKTFLFLTVGVMIIASAATHAVWVIVTPRWTFSVTTDKTTYTLGENVTITVSLENQGVIAHSFTSSISDPVAISIEGPFWGSTHAFIWWSSYHLDPTDFTIAPQQTLTRTITWNQTNFYLTNEPIPLGKYYIIARIPPHPNVWESPFHQNALFGAWTSINITSP